MNIRPKTRQQKLLDVLYPFFSDMADEYTQDQPLIVCRHLRKLGEEAVNDPWILPFLVRWDSQHPEEDDMSLFELHWVLKNFDTNISAQIRKYEKGLRAKHSPKARLRLINGGLTDNPTIPYVGPAQAVYEYDDY